jgi:hypothetical protein
LASSIFCGAFFYIFRHLGSGIVEISEYAGISQACLDTCRGNPESVLFCTVDLVD